jgi:uncharacterized iron-regulated membrane protein
MGAPKASGYKNTKGFFLLLIGLGILFPLVGLTIIAVLIIDLFIIRRIPALKRFLNA